jgi:hypothetical protein
MFTFSGPGWILSTLDNLIKETKHEIRLHPDYKRIGESAKQQQVETEKLVSIGSRIPKEKWSTTFVDIDCLSLSANKGLPVTYWGEDPSSEKLCPTCHLIKHNRLKGSLFDRYLKVEKSSGVFELHPRKGHQFRRASDVGREVFRLKERYPAFKFGHYASYKHFHITIIMVSKDMANDFVIREFGNFKKQLVAEEDCLIPLMFPLTEWRMNGLIAILYDMVIEGLCDDCMSYEWITEKTDILSEKGTPPRSYTSDYLPFAVYCRIAAGLQRRGSGTRYYFHNNIGFELEGVDYGDLVTQAFIDKCGVVKDSERYVCMDCCAEFCELEEYQFHIQLAQCSLKCHCGKEFPLSFQMVYLAHVSECLD